MTENTALMGSLGVSIILSGMFFLFSHRVGVLKAFGRKALSWRAIGLLAVAAALPSIGGISCIYISCYPRAIENPALLALGLAGIGWSCAAVFKKLEPITSKEIKPDLADLEKEQAEWERKRSD